MNCDENMKLQGTNTKKFGIFINPIEPEGGGEVIFACGKFKFKLFLNGLWYEPETL